MRRFWILIPLLIALAACDSLAAPEPTPVAIIVSPLPSLTPTEQPTLTPAPTLSPTPTATPDIRPTITPFPCDADSGRIEEFPRFPTAVYNNENLRYRVYIPPCYVEMQRRFPIVYLIHGLSYREQQWEDIGMVAALDEGIRAGTLPPMILVMPYFGELGQINSFAPNPSYETHILEELVPAVEQQFCVWEDRDYRAIAGISRGGFWAYMIAFRNPDIFGIVGGHSAYFPDNVREIPPPFNPLELARESGTLPTDELRLYLDSGASDSAGPSIQQLSNRLKERSIPHEFVINPVGGHDNDYWSAHVTDYLTFYGTDWPRQYDALPVLRGVKHIIAIFQPEI